MRFLLSKGGRQPSCWIGCDVTGSDAVVGSVGLVSWTGEGNFSGEVVGEDFVVGRVEGLSDDSTLLRGNGNSSGGGIGRMLVAPYCWGDIAEMTAGGRHAESAG